jgi:hypothetical protein
MVEKMKKSVVVAVIAIVGVMSLQVFADTIPIPEVSIMWSGGGGGSTTVEYTDDDLTPNGDDSYTLEGSWEGAACDADWDLTLDADPYIITGWGLVNTSGITQTYTLTFTTSVIPITISTVHGGSTGGSVTDKPGDGSLASASTVTSIPFYAGQIDGTTVLKLYDDPPGTSWTATFDGETVNILSQNSGLPGPTLPSGPVASSISIVHKFTLTAGDSISGTSNFIVTPEPATLVIWLLF